MTDKDKELEENIKFLANCCNKEYNDIRVDAVLLGAFELINRQQTEIERLKIENQSLRGAANSYKLHYNEAKAEAVKEFARQRDKVIKDFEKFAQRAFIDNPFACEYCVHSVENGRACLWKEEHEKDGVSCLGKYFKYYSNKMVGENNA